MRWQFWILLFSGIFVGATLWAEEISLQNRPPLLLASVESVDEEEEDDWGEEGEEEEDWGEEGEEDGFGEIEINVAEIDLNQEPSAFQWGGFFREELAYNFQEQDEDYVFSREEAELTKMRSVLNLYLDLDLGEDWKMKVSGNAFYDAYYSQKEEDFFSSETVSAYEQELELRDTFVQGPLMNNLWLKVGRQIIAWGQSDSSQIVDMANPRDQREQGQTDLEDARIPVTSTKLSYIQSGWELNLVAIHEFRANKVGTKYSDYDPYISLRKVYDIQDSELPSEKTEFLVRLFKAFSGGDIGFVFADVYEDDPYLEYVSVDLQTQVVTVLPKHKKITVRGLAGNMVQGSWLFYYDLAHKQGVSILRDDVKTQIQNNGNAVAMGTFTPQTWNEKDQVEAALGAEYSGINDLTLTIESEWTQIQDYEEGLANEETGSTLTLRVSYDLLNQTMNLNFLGIQLANDNGQLYRGNISYDIMDALEVSGGMILYEASQSDKFLYPYRNNDRILAGLKYSF